MLDGRRCSVSHCGQFSMKYCDCEYTNWEIRLIGSRSGSSYGVSNRGRDERLLLILISI